MIGLWECLIRFSSLGIMSWVQVFMIEPCNFLLCSTSHFTIFLLFKIHIYFVNMCEITSRVKSTVSCKNHNYFNRTCMSMCFLNHHHWHGQRPSFKFLSGSWILICCYCLQELNLADDALNRLQTVGLRFCGVAEQALPRLRGALPAGILLLTSLLLWLSMKLTLGEFILGGCCR